MEEAEDAREGAMQPFKPTISAASSHPLSPPNRLDIPSFRSTAGGRAFNRQFSSTINSDVARRPGIPPVHPLLPPTSPYSQIPLSVSHTPSHSRSISQPAFFSLDVLSTHSAATPSLSEKLASLPSDVNMDDESFAPRNPVRLASTISDGIPPRKAHRRSQSDIPFAFLQSSTLSPGLPPLPQPFQAAKQHYQFVKQESDCDREGEYEAKSDGDAGDDLISAYMNLDNLDTFNSSGAEDKNDLDSRASDSKANGAESSENEAESESSLNEGAYRTGERNERSRRSAAGDPAINNMLPRHCRSVSMDSFMGKLNFGDQLRKLPPSPGSMHVPISHNETMDGIASTFSLEFGKGEFNNEELKKIMANEKLAEIAMNDPKRAKRILANRQSAARSKERKMRYITELEHKVQTLQTEATTLSAQLTVLQRDSVGLASQNNHLKFRLQAMDQQALLREALNEALSTEVQRLKLATGVPISTSLSQQIHLHTQMLQRQQHFQHQSHVSHALKSPDQMMRPNADAADHEIS